MNPIRPDTTGTLEEFLEKSDRYLDEKTVQMKARGEYKPLAKVEELEEAKEEQRYRLEEWRRHI